MTSRRDADQHPLPDAAAHHPVPDALVHLAGTWHVERTVRDLADGSEGHFSGTVRFTPLPAPDEGGLLHHESGTFTWHGTARPAERTLRFLPGEVPGTARVEFADGRPFHDLDLRTGRHTADHPCAADLYRGDFEVADEDHWRTRWRVGGPAKDLLLITEYVRVPARPAAGSSARRGRSG
ncbi:DUF6314 family protein [Streptomyces formicae]|uniref:DUF6314 domain-containing protein n=1 Tax=Streptomyces formicae TaxID=1616117 RepID=A0A291Q4G7_9ACTN|nr:DUF6314 family protein [Streptomyces formicae]ATL26397.1 hypothetical protein KY5_1379 [Streptomyces formicae]